MSLSLLIQTKNGEKIELDLDSAKDLYSELSTFFSRNESSAPLVAVKKNTEIAENISIPKNKAEKSKNKCGVGGCGSSPEELTDPASFASNLDSMCNDILSCCS